MKNLVLACLVPLLALSCATGQIQEKPTRPGLMDDLPQGPSREHQKTSARARELFNEGNYLEARRLFELLSRQSSTSTEAASWHFNAGVCASMAKRCDLALDDFALARQAGLESHELYLRQGNCQLDGKESAQAISSFLAGLALAHGQPETRAALLVGLGRARNARGSPQLALESYEDALSLLMDSIPIREQRGHPFLSEIFFRQAQIFDELCRQVKMRLPVERMSRDLELKRNLFKKAEERYTLSVRLRHPHWAMRSGWALGQLSESFAHDIMDSEIPQDLTPEELSIYYKELQPYTQAIFREALDYYDRSVKLATRLGFDDPWLEKIKERARELRQALKTDSH